MRDQEIVGLWEAYHQVYAPQKNSEEVELWVNQLVEEGYDLSEYTWDDMVEIHEDQMLNGTLLTKHGFTPENRRDWKEMVRKYGPEPISNPRPTGKGQSSTRSASKVSPQSSEPPKRKRRTKLSDVQIKENRGERDHGECHGSHEHGKDMFEHILVAQYFYEMGLNENGVEILIEELGISQFIDFVYDIAEESLLIEARSGGSRIEPVTAKGQKFKSGKPTGKSLERLRAQKAARREAEEKASAAKPSGLKASLQRQSAITNAKSKQKPSSSSSTQTKKGIGGLIGSIVQRAKQDTELLKKSVDTAKGVAARRGAEVKAVFDVARERGKKVEQSPQATRARRKATVAVGRAAQAAGKTAVKAAGAAGAAAGEGVKAHRQGKTGAQIAGRAAGTFVHKMTKEDYEYAEAWVNELLEEGYDLSEYTWDDMYEIYEQQLDEGLGSAIKGLFNGRKKPEAPAAPESRGAQLRRKYGITSRTGPESPRGRILSRSQQQIDADKRKYGEGSAPARESEAARNKQLQGGYSQFGMNDRRGSGNAARRRAENLQKEGYDLYDLFLSHLLDEGYADTEEAALAIMTNMSEEWKQSIMGEEKKELPQTKMYRKAGELARSGIATGDEAKKKRSAKIVSAITRETERKRFDEIGKSPKHN